MDVMMTSAHKANPIPNILTGIRLAAGVVMFLLLAGATSGFPFVSAMLSPDDQFAMYRTGFWIFVIAASTDWIDGYLARRWNAETRWGAILDPIADKILVTGAILGVLTSGSVQQIIIPCGLILFREFAVSALRETMAGRIELPVTLAAKWKTTVQMVAIPFLLYDARLFGVIDTGVWGTWLIWASAVLTVWSMVYYLQKALPEIRARVK